MGNARLWWQKWRCCRRSSLPWNRARIHRELARRRAPLPTLALHGNVLEMFAEGRLEVGEHTLFEPNVWHTALTRGASGSAHGSFLNIGVMVAAVDLVEIGDHCMFANGCFVTDGSHRFDDPDTPVPGRASRARRPPGWATTCGVVPTMVVTSGVTIGERSVIGANSVVTFDIPPFSIATGAPARCSREVEYPEPSG